MRSVTYRFGGWPTDDVRLHVVEEPRDLAYLGGWLEERSGEYLGIDAETNALDPFQYGFQTRLVQMADMHESFVVPITIDPWLTAGLIYKQPRWVAHFAENDERFLCRGLPMEPVRWDDVVPHFSDTQAVLAVYDPRTVTTMNKKDRIHPAIPRRKGLKDTTTRLLTPTLAAVEERMYERFLDIAPRGNMSMADVKAYGFANIPIDDPTYQLYSALDPLAAIRLFHLMRHGLTERGQWARTEAAMAEQWFVDRATYLGLPVDGPYARWLRGALNAEIDARMPLLSTYGIKRSGLGLSVPRAFNGLGVGVSPKVDRDGKEYWDREALKLLLARCDEAFADPRYAGMGVPAEVVAVRDLALAVLDVRKADKYRSTWVEPMIWALDNAGGVMHPSMRGTGTVTSRMTAQKSATAGPLHSAPKRDTRLRAAVRAPAGWVVVTADLKQAEPYVMAALSGDPDYLRDLQAGDINSVLASQVYGAAYNPAEGKAPSTASYGMRQRAKFAWLAACYGAMPPKVDALLGVATGVMAQWRARYATFWAYADEMNQQTHVQLDSGHVVPLWDRFWVNEDTGELVLRTRYDGTPIPSRLGLNAVTQGSQADVLKVSIHRLWHWGWGWALRFFVHDEIVGMVPAWMADAFVQVLSEAMTVRFRGVVIECEPTIEGTTWQQQPEAFGLADIVEDEVDDDGLVAV